MQILHLTDTHLYDPGKPVAERLHYGRIDPAKALDRVVERVQTMAPFDAIVHSGDASDDGSEGSYRLLRERLQSLAEGQAKRHGGAVPPVVIAMGNHDAPAACARDSGREEGHPITTVVPIPSGGRIIVLDTSVAGAGWGTLDDDQLLWLDRELASHSGDRQHGAASGPTIVVMHHPPMPVASRLFQALSLGSRTHGFGEASAEASDDGAGSGADGCDFAQRLADLLRGRADAVLSGHLHHAATGECGGVPVFVAPGVTNVVDPLTAAGESGTETALALSGAAVVDVSPSAVGSAWSVTHVSSHWPNAGDVRGAEAFAEPVYRFDPATVDRIIDAAGRPSQE